jgi:hypothetical protein
MTATRVFPFVRSDIFNLNGLAHKHDTLLEYSITESSQDLNEILSTMRSTTTRRNVSVPVIRQQVFPGVIPAEFNPRNYAFETEPGCGPVLRIMKLQMTFRRCGSVFEIACRRKLARQCSSNSRLDDMGNGASFFPKSDRDNFGEDFGLLYNHYRWNVSDRTSLLTDANWDLFENAQNMWSVGVLSQRSLRGSVYLGYREVKATNYL